MPEQRMKLVTYLLEERPWVLCYVAFVGPDRLQRPLWEEVQALDPRTNEYFRQLDSALGQILEQLGPDDTLFVVSDHGFQGVRRSFDINEYLYSKGLLRLRSSAERDRASRFADLKYLLKQVGLLSSVLKVKKGLRSAGIVKRKRHRDLYNPPLSAVGSLRTLASSPSLSGYGGE